MLLRIKAFYDLLDTALRGVARPVVALSAFQRGFAVSFGVVQAAGPPVGFAELIA